MPAIMITQLSTGETLPTGVPDAFLTAYIDAALWSTTDFSDESGGEPMDSNYDPSDITPATRDRMLAECAAFIAACEAEDISAFPHYDHPEYSDIELSGHDFWLTRNRHGAGYWDRGLEDIGDELTRIAESQGSADLYVGDDGHIHQN